MSPRTTVLLSIAIRFVAALSPAVSNISGSVSIKPHSWYSSSVGVLGCKVNTNRVAYWPSPVDCDNICVRLSHAGRALHVLKIDQSGGSHDISYDAWNYLYVGKSATEVPVAGGAVDVNYQFVDPSECHHLLSDNGKLPLSASNSMNFVAACTSRPESWVAKNFELFNINDPVCMSGHDEVCSLDMAMSNQPSCPHILGEPATLTGHTVVDIPYSDRSQHITVPH